MRHSTRKKALELAPMGVYHASLKPDDRIEDDLREVIDRCNDAGEQHRCLIRLENHRDRMSRQDAAERRLRVSEGHARSRDPRRHLPKLYEATIALLIDHASGATLKRTAEDIGYIEKSKHSLTEPEIFAQQAQRGRIAWERFREGAAREHGQGVASQCVLVIINGKYWSKCCESLGWPVNSRNYDKLKAAMTQGLHETAQYLGS